MKMYDCDNYIFNDKKSYYQCNKIMYDDENYVLRNKKKIITG